RVLRGSGGVQPPGKASGWPLSSIEMTSRPAVSCRASQLSRTRPLSATVSSTAATALANSRSAAAARLLPYGTLRGMLAALAWLPLAAAACLLARGLWQALPLRGGARWLALALLAALALPAALAALPRWLIP